MYKISELKTLLAFDIESLPEKRWNELSKNKKHLWLEKYHYKYYPQEIEFRKKEYAIEQEISNLELVTISSEPSFEEIYNKYAGLHSEFAKVWCISFGVLNLKNEIDINTIQEDDEKDLLEKWIQVLNHCEAFNLAGYNIGEFDIPFILTRMQINGLNKNYPKQLQLKNAKPWTVSYVDFQNDWKGTKWQSVSLGLVCEALGVKTPKDKFNNHQFTTLMLNGQISKEDGIEYCEKDVRALFECMLKCSSNECNFAGEEKPKVWSKRAK